ncbi:GDSL-like lipase/acylhydrolase family protein [Sinobacterium caligoides]|uniref:GDSL-like lipase/acylhydrolase family protein n=1 Tax=Sinobacterium caligoides TaxID=933926 RepID=A0A3N2DNK9_9GAMM|nr:SGNH/GDSL hydrolase family protein [Sinobacterium caligoides]ROS01387.1 GDSL-like lipase/acylhydrolase family protein [Sinobacterium caligoides]
MRNTSRLLTTTVLLTVSLCFSQSHAAPINLGVIGDSVSAEYYLDGYDDGLIKSDVGTSFDTSLFARDDVCTDSSLGDLLDLFMGLVPMYTDFPARSWLQILQQQRPNMFNFGRYTDDPDFFGEPRLRGYEYNFARVGGTVVAPGFSQPEMAVQVAQMLPYAQRGELDVVFVNIGSNDFAARELKGGSFCNQGWQDFQGQLVEQMFSGIDQLISAGVSKIIIGELPLGTATSTSETNDIILSRIIETNELIKAEAAQRNLPVIDGYAFSQDPSRIDAEGNVSIGDYIIPVGSKGSMDDAIASGYAGNGELGNCASNGRCGTLKTTLKFFATDGLHPNTPIQGLIANEVLRSLNERYGYNIDLLSDAEILAAGGTFEPDNWLQIRQKGNDDCLTVKSNHVNLTVAACDASNPLQQWQMNRQGDRYQISLRNNPLGATDGSCITESGRYFTLQNCNDTANQHFDIYGGDENKNWFLKADSRNACLYQHDWYKGGKVFGGTANCGLYYSWNYMRWGFVRQGVGSPVTPSSLLP